MIKQKPHDISLEKAEILGLLCAEGLGELAGIFAGDGTLYKTQRGFVMEIRGTPNETKYYEKYVKPLFEKISLKDLKLIKRYYTKKTGYVIGIRICGIKIKKIFHDILGFPIGKKSYTIKIPQAIIDNKDCWKSYIRGIFDTDGSFYIRKSGPGLKYRQPIIDICSKSDEHILQIKRLMENLGFNVWLERSNSKIRMAGWKNAVRFFKVIKPHNNKKLEKFNIIKAGMAETN